jgi:hypothetical protein
MTAALANAAADSSATVQTPTDQVSLHSPMPRHEAKRARRTTGKLASRKLTQTHLDLGQRDFFSTRCPTCGLVYTPGKAEDDKLHAEVHKGRSVPRYTAGRADMEVATDGVMGNIVRIPSSALSKPVRWT